MYEIEDIRKHTASYYEDIYSLLNDEQKKKIDKKKSIEDKRLSLLGLKLASVLSSTPISSVHYRNGAPYVDKNCISISHKYPYVGAAISDKKIGIDIETIRKVDASTIRYLGAKDSLDALIRWTKIESLYKSSLKKRYRQKTIILDKSVVITITDEIH